MKARAAWGPAEYAKATGRDRATVEILKTRLQAGSISIDQARASAEAQGVDPELVTKAVKK